MKVSENGVLREPTAEEIKMNSYAPSPEERIAELKAQLDATDYKATKYSEGWISPEEYEPIRQARQKIREEINRLESMI